MSRREFVYCKDGEFAKMPVGQPEYPICYRSVVAYALFRLEKSPSQTDAISEFKNLYQSFKEEKIYRNKNFLDFYPVRTTDSSTEESGCLLVDNTNGCFPLLFYTQKSAGDLPAASRKEALSKALDDLNNNLSSIVAEFGKHEEWSKDLQDILQEKCFNYPNDRSRG